MPITLHDWEIKLLEMHYTGNLITLNIIMRVYEFIAIY